MSRKLFAAHCTRTAAGSMPSNRGAGSSSSRCPTVPALRSSQSRQSPPTASGSISPARSAGCRYSSVGAAFFCPACGHNSASTTFLKAVESVRTSVTVRSAPSRMSSEPGLATTRRRTPSGKSSRTAWLSSWRRSNASPRRRSKGCQTRPPSRFARISSRTWPNRARSGDRPPAKGTTTCSSASELAALGVFFQQRHLLAHREGLVDQVYVDKTQDKTYKVGQKLVVRETAVIQLADLVEQLAMGLKTLVAASSTVPPSATSS